MLFATVVAASNAVASGAEREALILLSMVNTITRGSYCLYRASHFSIVVDLGTSRAEHDIRYREHTML